MYHVQEKKSHWEVSIAKTKSSLARANQNLRNAYRSADLEGIVAHTNTVENLTAGLKTAEEAFAVLFPA